MSNCTNPSAKNYNPGAITDDGSCLYLTKIGDVCYAFQDADTSLVTDNSFTLSWALEDNNWVFYHDYIPDFYIQSREKLFSLYFNSIYQNDEGNPGKYYENTPKPFFIDIVFAAKDEFMLNSIEWMTEILSAAGKAQQFKTLTHITAWNNYQCTKRVALSEVFKLLEFSTHRKTKGEWSFNDFYDIVINPDVNFLDTIFKNFSILPGNINSNQSWYNRSVLSDTFTIIRFEFDNGSADKVLLLDADINLTNTAR